MNKIIVNYFKTSIGEFIIGSFDNKICIFDYRFRKRREELNSKIKKILCAEFEEGTNAVIEKSKQQLLEYLEEKRSTFEIPILLIGTEFEKKVWEELSHIKYGETIHYLELVKRINKKNASRAVANANGRNSIAIIVPCHRVISINGSLGGYSGGVPIKRKLLELEKR